jgi:hypothetical protein
MERPGTESELESWADESKTHQPIDRGPSQKQKMILEGLRKKPDASMMDLAKSLSMTYETVTNAVDTMKKKQWVEHRHRIAPPILGFPERYRVDITVIPAKLRLGEGGRPEDIDNGKRIQVHTQQGLARYIVNTLSKDAKFLEVIMVEEVSVLLGGPADMSATVWAKNNESMLKFVTYGLRMAEGIQTTSTFLEHWSFPDRRI